MFLSSRSDKTKVMLVACSEYRAKLTPAFAVSEIFEGPKGSAVPATIPSMLSLLVVPHSGSSLHGSLYEGYTEGFHGSARFLWRSSWVGGAPGCTEMRLKGQAVRVLQARLSSARLCA